MTTKLTDKEIASVVGFFEQIEKKVLDERLKSISLESLIEFLNSLHDIFKQISNGNLECWRHQVLIEHKIFSEDSNKTIENMENFNEFGGFTNEKIELMISWLFENIHTNVRYIVLVLLPEAIFLLLKLILDLSDNEAALYMVSGGIEMQSQSLKHLVVPPLSANQEVDVVKIEGPSNEIIVSLFDNPGEECETPLDGYKTLNRIHPSNDGEANDQIGPSFIEKTENIMLPSVNHQTEDITNLSICHPMEDIEDKSIVKPIDQINKTDSGTVIFTDSLTEANECIRNHEIEYTLKYSTYISHADFGKTDIYKAKHKVYWNDENISYTGVPYFIAATKTLDCQHGKDRGAAQRKKIAIYKKHNSSKKYDCPAQVILKEIVYFPDFKLDDNTIWKRTDRSKKLRSAIVNNEQLNTVRKVLVSLPPVSIHTEVKQNGFEAGSCQTLDKELIKYIYELVQEGVTNEDEMQRHLKIAMKRNIFNYSRLPAATNKRFYPKRCIVRKQMREATKQAALNCSKNSADNEQSVKKEMKLPNHLGPACREVSEGIKNLTFFAEYQGTGVLDEVYTKLLEVKKSLKRKISFDNMTPVHKKIVTNLDFNKFEMNSSIQTAVMADDCQPQEFVDVHST